MAVRGTEERRWGVKKGENVCVCVCRCVNVYVCVLGRELEVLCKEEKTKV